MYIKLGGEKQMTGQFMAGSPNDQHTQPGLTHTSMAPQIYHWCYTGKSIFSVVATVWTADGAGGGADEAERAGGHTHDGGRTAVLVGTRVGGEIRCGGVAAARSGEGARRRDEPARLQRVVGRRRRRPAAA